MIGPWLARLDGHDRALLTRMSASARSHAELRAWRAVTHAGGSVATVLACGVPLLVGAALPNAFALRLGGLVTATVVGSHLAVQVVKRTVGRPRPTLGAGVTALAAEPDRFSFPSGHAAAAMSVALGYATAWPNAQPLLVALAVLVGVSRAVLGVHYVGDVIAGQLLALGAALVLRGIGT
ncbi:MAG: phosphatase PAP2 family protein [Gemmatirosa sp.]|nr:phosphatase PAP2 family protein [Gemmatirosa sp.]